MRTSKAIVWLSSLIAVLALVAAGTGLFWQDAGSSFSFTTLRGETVQMYGRGLYRYDSLFTGAGYMGQDATTLFLGIPLLVLLTLLYRRGSPRAGLLLTGVLAYFVYVYVSMAFNAAYNNLFLVYVALFSASFFAFVLAFSSIDLQALSPAVLTRLPRRGPALFMFAAGAVTLVVWLGPLVGSLIQGRPPDLLGTYTTMVTDALDLAIITPATIVSCALILRRAPLGYRIAIPLLGIIVMLVPVIAVGTVSQMSAGVSFSTGEIIGPISGFGTLGLVAIWVTVAILRQIPNSVPS